VLLEECGDATDEAGPLGAANAEGPGGVHPDRDDGGADHLRILAMKAQSAFGGHTNTAIENNMMGDLNGLRVKVEAH